MLGEKVNIEKRSSHDKPEICQSTIQYAGSLGRWDKELVNQASDVPSIIIFFEFFYKITKIKIKNFECPKSMM